MSYNRTYHSVRGRICILTRSPRITDFFHSIEIVGVFPPSLLKLNCLLRTFNQRTRKILNLWLINMRIDLRLSNPHPKRLVGVILLLVKVLYLERKGGGILSLSWQCNRVLVQFEGVSVEEFLDDFFSHRRGHFLLHTLRNRRTNLLWRGCRVTKLLRMDGCHERWVGLDGKEWSLRTWWTSSQM